MSTAPEEPAENGSAPSETTPTTDSATGDASASESPGAPDAEDPGVAETVDAPRVETASNDEGVEATAEPKKRPRPPKVGPPTVFVRTLSDDLLQEIAGGPAAKLIQKLVAADFDVHVRDGAVVAYWGGTILVTIAKKPPTKKEAAEFPDGVLAAMLPRKIVEKVELPKRSGLKGSLACWQIDEAFLQTWDAQLAALTQESERQDVRDGPLEQKFMMTNPGSAGILPIDRQVQLPNHRAKLDALALDPENDRLLLVDLRSGASADTARAHEQLGAFYAEVTGQSGGLDGKFVDELAKMMAQRTRLGIPNKLEASRLRAGMPVACLLGLAHFRQESSMKDRLFDNAAKVTWPFFLCEFAGSDARVPRHDRWETLGKLGSGAKPKSAFGY